MNTINRLLRPLNLMLVHELTTRDDGTGYTRFVIVNRRRFITPRELNETTR